MLTKGIVCVDKLTKKRFISDALFNRGISGSPVFALPDGEEDYGWMGMASSAASQTLLCLEPKEAETSHKIDVTAFSSDIVVKKKQFINYGITFSISIEEIATFIADNIPAIIGAGINADILNAKLNNKTKEHSD